MSHYHDPSDGAYNRVYRKETPAALAGFAAFNDAVFAAEGVAIPLKYRELMAVAVAVTTQCVYCIEGHTRNAVKAGATEQEVAEAVWVASALRAGGAFAHGRLAFKFAEAALGEGEHAGH